MIAADRSRPLDVHRSHFNKALAVSILSHAILALVLWSIVPPSFKQWLTTEAAPSSVPSFSVSFDTEMAPAESASDSNPVSTENASSEAPESEATTNVKSSSQPSVVKVTNSKSLPKKVAQTSTEVPRASFGKTSENSSGEGSEPTGDAANQVGAASVKPVEGGIVDAQMLGMIPEYPRYARQHNQQGRVVLRVSLGADGAIENTNVITSSGFPLLDEAASKALEHATFPRGTFSAASALIAFRFKLVAG